MVYVPLSNRIVGKTKKKGEKVVNGIIIPDNVNQSPYMTIEILAVGRGYVAQDGSIVSMESKVGDKVILINSTPFVLPREGNEDLAPDEDLVVFQESDIYVKVNS